VAAAPADAAAAGRALAAMLRLQPALATALPAGDLIGALCHVGNRRGEKLANELLTAANALQVALTR
jgi:hypothetical protein